jgi:hypothetical protein
MINFLNEHINILLFVIYVIPMMGCFWQAYQKQEYVKELVRLGKQSHIYADDDLTMMLVTIVGFIPGINLAHIGFSIAEGTFFITKKDIK